MFGAVAQNENSLTVLVMSVQYASMLRTLADALGMKNLPRGTEEAGGASAAQLVTNRVKLLRERISRKEELLSGYEADLLKLRYSGASLGHSRHGGPDKTKSLEDL